MSNLQIKDIDEELYQELKRVAMDENRSVSQQVLFFLRSSLAQRRNRKQTDNAAQTLLSLAGSWEDTRSAEEVVGEIKRARHSSSKLSEGF